MQHPPFGTGWRVTGADALLYAGAGVTCWLAVVEHYPTGPDQEAGVMCADIHPQHHRQLFLDDGAIESMSGLQRVLHQPVNTGPVIQPDRSRGQVAVQSSSVPQWNPEKGVWEWWYKGFTTYTDEYLTLYATSADGEHWEMPDLGLYEWNGSSSNNVAFVSDQANLCHVIRDVVDGDPQRRYKGLFSDGDHMDRYPGVSADGFRWEISGGPPIPSHDTSTLVRDDIGNRYLAIVKHRTEWGRSAFLTTSPDFDYWTDPELVLHTDEIDQRNRKRRIQAVVDDPAYLSPPVVDDRDYLAQLYMMPVMPYEGLYVGFPLLFNPSGADGPQNNHTGLNQVELAVSRDARQWERVADRAVFVGVEPWEGGANFGNAQVALCGAPLARDEEIWIYHIACRYRGHRDLFADLDPSIYNDDFFDPSTAICLAKLRRDGFVSLHPETAGGELLTKPFNWEQGGLRVNADVEARGEILVEVVDGDSLCPLPGRSTGECQAMRGDQLAGEIKWNDGSRPPIGDRPIRLRFFLRDASLYSFWLA